MSSKKQDLYNAEFENLADVAFSADYNDLINTPVGGPGGVFSVNSRVGDVVLDKTDVGLGNVDNTSDADKPVSTNQQAALDLKLDISSITSDAGKIALYDISDSHLTNAPYLTLTDDGALSFFKEAAGPNPLADQFRPIYHTEYDLSLPASVHFDSVTLFQEIITVDRNNEGFDFGSNSEGNSEIGISTRYFGHGGSGYVHRVNAENLFCEFGNEDNTPAGTADTVGIKNDLVVIRPNYTINNLSLLRSNAELRNSSSIGSFNAIQSSNEIEGNATVTGFWNVGYFGTSLHDTAVMQGSEQLTLRLAVNDTAQHQGFWSLLNANFYNEGTSNNGTGIQLNIQNAASGTISAYFTGLNLIIDNQGTAQAGCAGININFNGSGTYVNAPQGVNINMGTYDTTVERRQTFSGGAGSFSNAQEISTSPNLFFDQANILYTEFHVTSGSPITSTSFIANNFSTAFVFEDDMDGGVLGLGATGVGFVGQVAVSSGKTAAIANFCAGGASIPDFDGLGGTLQKANIFNALGIVDSGGSNNVIIEEVRGFVMPAGSLGNAIWGIDIQDDTAENHLAKSLVIGTNDTVANDSVALELSDKKAFKLTPMTITERDTLTPLAGMVIFVQDGALEAIQAYTGTEWISAKHYVPVPLTASSSGAPGDTAFDSNYYYICIANDTWVRTVVSTWV